MQPTLTPRQRARLERWEREGADSSELSERQQALQRRRPLLAALRAGKAGAVEVEGLAATSAWVEPAQVRLGLQELDPSAVARRMAEATSLEDPRRGLERLAADPFPNLDFLAELHGWANAERRPIHAPWSTAGMAWFDAAVGDGDYVAEVESFPLLVAALEKVGRATPEVPLAYEIDALLDQIIKVDEAGIAPEDVAVLSAVGDSTEVDERLARDLDHLWSKLERLLGAVAADSLGDDEYELRLWPWREGDDTFPFVWARLKAATATAYATHLGVFVSPAHCNVGVDLEKDLIDAGEAGESLDDVHRFYEDGLADALSGETPEGLQVWTDPDNVSTLHEFLGEPYGEFMARNNDPEHPWPKLGRIVEVEEMVAAGADWSRRVAEILQPLVPVYRTMLASYR